MKNRIPVGFVAPSSPVPPVEFGIAVRKLEESGILAFVHPQCKARHQFFAGRDEERAEAFFEYAKSEDFSVVWCARGGYGANRLLPYLEKMTRAEGAPPRKLLIGYSDSTALHEFVRARWGWSALHAHMPSFRSFILLKRHEWDSTVGFAMGRDARPAWRSPGFRLKFLGSAPHAGVTGFMTGGNLSVWCGLVGTPWMPSAREKIVFFEDVGEPMSRLDRQVQQLVQSGALDGARAIVLGDFLDCPDPVTGVLKKAPKPGSVLERRLIRSPKPRELRPLRPVLSTTKSLESIFAPIGEKMGIPVAHGLPVGHGPRFSPLPLDAEYSIGAKGTFHLVRWEWIRSEPVEAERLVETVDRL